MEALLSAYAEASDGDEDTDENPHGCPVPGGTDSHLPERNNNWRKRIEEEEDEEERVLFYEHKSRKRKAEEDLPSSAKGASGALGRYVSKREREQEREQELEKEREQERDRSSSFCTQTPPPPSLSLNGGGGGGVGGGGVGGGSDGSEVVKGLYMKDEADGFQSAGSLAPRIRRALDELDSDGVSHQSSHIPRKDLAWLQGHSRGVNCVRWSKPHGQLLASASMDRTVKIWSIWSDDGQDSPKCVRTIASHANAVKDVCWSAIEPHFIVSGGYDNCIKLTDVETGQCVRNFVHEEYINAVKFHPKDPNLFLSGGSKAALRCWDIRSSDGESGDGDGGGGGGGAQQDWKSGGGGGGAVRVLGGMGGENGERGAKVFPKLMGQVLDIDFHRDGKEFVATYDVARRNTLDKAVVVWGFDLGVVLSNQVYLEGYTCPCVRYHPTDEVFAAQSNADYVCVFSARAPYKRNKHRRFSGHSVSGYRVQCGFSPDGQLLVTGSADGGVHFYKFGTGKALKILQAHSMVCTDVVYHPLLPSVIATCSWDGMVSVFE